LTGGGAAFSADGSLLSYYASDTDESWAVSVESGERVLISPVTAEPPSWHPTDALALLTELHFQGESFTVHATLFDFGRLQLIDLSGRLVTDDAFPTWSPDGEWIAMGRKVPRAPVGRQLWIMRADGNESRALTDDIESNLGAPSWSPDGSSLVVQRFRTDEIQERPALWQIDVDGGDARELVDAGIQPMWLD
jgi:Tol biopolymer transport system component